MTLDEAWEDAIEALKLRYLQGNSQIPNIDKWINERVAEAINHIRDTPKDISTDEKVFGTK